jgi:membrane-associated phospholipid phosphatase
VNRSLAKLLSIVFHPLLLPTYLFAFILYYMPASMLALPMQSRWLVLVMIILSTFIIPSAGAYVMVRMGRLDSMEMDQREQRGLPLLFTSACYGVTAYLLYKEKAFDDILFFMMGIIAVSVFVTYLVSQFWKISAHSVGVGGALGILLMLNMVMPAAGLNLSLLIAIILTGAVLSARLALHAHTPEQVYAGAGCGLMLALVATFVAL